MTTRKMRLLLVAHGNSVEIERAASFANNHCGGLVQNVFGMYGALVDLDKVRSKLEDIDALVLFLTSQSGLSSGPEESELQRIERLCMLEAAEIGKTIGVVGIDPALYGRHMMRHAQSVDVVGAISASPDLKELRARFREVIRVPDLSHGATEFYARLLAHVRNPRIREASTVESPMMGWHDEAMT